MIKQTYEILRPKLKTGDILLFSGRGFASNLIKLGTWSRWSHVGMVYEGKLGLKCWESTSLNNEKCGVQMSPLCDRLREYNGRVAVRRLHTLRDNRFYNDIAAYEGIMRGITYEKNGLELIGAAMPWRNMVDFTTVFCSEKEAGCFKYCDLFAAWNKKHANEFTPADFSSKRGDVDNRMLGCGGPLSRDTKYACLEEEIEFDLKAPIMSWEDECRLQKGIK